MSAVALRHLPVPDCLPPLETEPPAPRDRRRPAGPQPVQGVLSLVVDGAADGVGGVGVHPGAGVADDELDFGPVPTGRADLPDPLAWSRGLVQVLVEVMAGLRPASQLLRWTTTAVHEQVRRRVVPTGRGPRRAAVRRPIVRSVRVCEPVDGVAEVSAVVAGQHRAQALALRLEGRDGRWRVTALQAG